MQNVNGVAPGCSDDPQEFDLSKGHCRDILLGLMNAAMAITSGNSRTRVRIAERWTDYGRGNYTQLIALYTTMYTSCRNSGADVSGLPSMAPGDRVQRGGPGLFLRGGMPHF